MATPAVLQREEDFLVYSSIFDPPKGEKVKYRGNLIEKKIEFLEGLAGKVSNRRARRWVNDRLLIELVPRLDAEEIRGLFAPPPWGDNVPLSPFCMTNTEEWDAFRSVDMDKEVCMINALKNSSSKRKDRVDADKMAAVDAWRRVDCRTREALRRSYLPELIASYEECIRAFIKDGGDEDDLVLQIQDPFHRLLLHGVCEVDAFTETPFKGNPAAVCFLEEGEGKGDEKWMQNVAMEFNIAATCFLTPISSTQSDTNDQSVLRFHLRWFSSVAELKLCGHGTLAAAHVLFASRLARTNVIEFVTVSGVLIVKRVPTVRNMDAAKFSDDEPEENFSIELDFPTDPVLEFESATIPLLPETLNGAHRVNISKTANKGDLIVELSSGKTVADLQPQLDEIRKCPGRGVIVTGPAPDGSGFDFFSRFFCPKLGINEDPVCGSAHCALVPYWSKKLGKCDLVAYMASPRGGVLDLHFDEATQRVLIRGKAVTVMEGSLLS
ncbi:uncharacterized isomerase BH0283-like isoform X2 [Macadamia integrifolia]|uniref:uncharacterized isomerase BH0283-like isoform X2 n=1 Tax=Macadamia integrifolia TaxID=60698 RepID=UPI001C4FBE8F|nr:uncharacterized isomerase BH0283-like isoform X2 [Macadamia integrifolia]